MSVNDLHQATERGDVAEVRRLVATGVDVDPGTHHARAKGPIRTRRTNPTYMHVIPSHVLTVTPAVCGCAGHGCARYRHEED